MTDFKFTEVDGKNLESAAISIDSDIKELRVIGTFLSGGIMGNLSTCWAGAGKDSFEKQFTVYAALFSKYVDGIESLNDQLKTAARNYNNTDDAVGKLITRLRK